MTDCMSINKDKTIHIINCYRGSKSLTIFFLLYPLENMQCSVDLRRLAPEIQVMSIIRTLFKYKSGDFKCSFNLFVINVTCLFFLNMWARTEMIIFLKKLLKFGIEMDYLMTSNKCVLFELSFNYSFNTV